MAQVVLDRARVVAIVGELVAGRMPQHMAVNQEPEAVFPGRRPRPDVVHSSLYLPEAVYEALRESAFKERCKIHDLVMLGIEMALKKRGYYLSGLSSTAVPPYLAAFRCATIDATNHQGSSCEAVDSTQLTREFPKNANFFTSGVL
jgi:hypothetical protein